MGRPRKVWKFYDCVNDVLGNKPATRPAVVIDTSNDAEQCGEEVTIEEGAKDVEKTDAVVDDVKMAGQNASGDGGMEDTGEKLRDDDVRVEQVESKTEVKKEKQRKKRTREDKFEKAMNKIIEKVTQAQKENDEMFMKLEKRMKLDERMMEMEDRRLREEKAREERQKREEREFQLRMVMMMRQQGGMGSPSHPFSPAYDYNILGSSSSNSSQQWSESDV